VEGDKATSAASDFTPKQIETRCKLDATIELEMYIHLDAYM
jgi:hypothetical protein